jgi:nicotinic acid mononucleotide adenylyltransferase
VTSLSAALPALEGRMIEAPPDADALHRPRIVLVDAPTAPVSSTEIRQRVARGGSIAGLVPDAVARHIEKHRLYRGTDLALWRTPRG